MSTRIHYSQCPVCGQSHLTPVFGVKDHTVSGEQFTILHCGDCGLRFTQDVPDAATIGPYYQSEDYISHTNTSKGFVNRLYLLVRRRTLRQKRKLVCRVTGLQKGSLLDVGSGTGAFLGEMKRAGWEVTGLEPDAGARKVAGEVHAVKLQEMDAFHHLPEASFDAITLWHVLEHVHDLQGYMARFARLLRPNGRLLIAVPNYTSRDADIYGAHWAAYDVPRHLYHFSPASMERLASLHGLVPAGIRPMWFDSFYVSILSSRYRNGRTNLVAAFFNGLRSNLAALGKTSRCSSLIYIFRK